jgi:hypothetical protein
VRFVHGGIFTGNQASSLREKGGLIVFVLQQSLEINLLSYRLEPLFHPTASSQV